MNDRKDDDHKTDRGPQAGAQASKETIGDRAPRKAAPLEEPTTPEEETAFRELIDETLRDGGEVVASDGEREIVRFDPLAVTGDSWVPHQGKKMYTEKVLLKLGDVPAAVAIAGFGLLDGKGVQTGWCQLAEPVNVQPNTTVGIEDSIIF
jgi:hypothetical protein